MTPQRNYAGAEKRIFDGERHLLSWSSAPAVVDILPEHVSVAQIQQLEVAIAEQCEPVEIEPVHYFADGLYGREITIPAGTVLTGKMHKQAHLNFLMRGEITVWTDQGMKRLIGPCVVVSQPGCKRAGYAHTDTVWITVHASHETDLLALEAELIEPEIPALAATEGHTTCLGSQ